MRECFVGIRHAMRIFLLLDRVAAIVRRVKQLSRETIGHRFLTSAASELNYPANCERAAPLLMYLNRDLVCGSSYTARFHFDSWPNVFDRALENFERFFAGLLAYLSQSIVKGSLGQRLLPAPHAAVDELGHQRTVVNGIRENRASFCNSSSRHGTTSRLPSAASRHTLSGSSCDR